MIRSDAFLSKVEHRSMPRKETTDTQAASRGNGDPNDAMCRSPQKLSEIAPKRHWCFVWAGFPKEWRSLLESLPVLGGTACILQGDRTQEPVLKGFIELKKKGRPHALGLPKTLTWEGCGEEIKALLRAKSLLHEALTWGSCKQDVPFRQLVPNPYP